METVDCVVAGAGVIGIAVARSLAAAGRDVIVLEKNDSIGHETSSRNSEVIHAGIYYPKGSLMARYCVEGRRRLYDYCADRGVPFRKSGKLIVATDEAEALQLGEIRNRAIANGVENIELISRRDAAAMEPELRCAAALHSPETGILDSHAYMLALQGDAENDGAVFVYRSPVLSGRPSDQGVEIEVGGDDPIWLRARLFVNAAGLYAPALARATGMPERFTPTPYFAKGHYFTLDGPSPFTRLIYPVPVPGGLGVHLTLDLSSRARFGPDIQWIDGIDYTFDEGRNASFYAAIRRYWPGLRDDALQPGYTGIRPKIVPKGAPPQDFAIQGPTTHGIRGVVNLFGIESPGLTSAIALADLVRDIALA